MTRTSRTLISCGLAALIVAALLGAAGGPATAALRNTPKGEILVITQNLEEAYSMGGGDLANHFELDNFAKRVKAIVPQIPDVVLLQEVNHETSLIAAKRLSARLGQRFVVAVRPIANTTIEYSDRQVHTETAILLNRKTMATSNGGGYYATTYPRTVSAGGGRVDVRRQAFMLARERGSNIKVPLVSLHFAREISFNTAKQSNNYRGKWAKQIKAMLSRRYTTDSAKKATVIAGDFNMGRCYRGAMPDCPKAAYHKEMIDSPHPYVDALEKVGFFPTGVDVLYGKGNPLRGGRDDSGDFAESDRQRFYSDHIMRWAVIEPNSR